MKLTVHDMIKKLDKIKWHQELKDRYAKTDFIKTEKTFKEFEAEVNLYKAFGGIWKW